jgi:hypothetical protein
MDTRAFADSLPGVFGGDLEADHPLDRRLKALLDDVEGMASENKLALLNHAASLLPADEAYVEVGSWKGLSIIAAMLGNDDGVFYAIENFTGFWVDGARVPQELQGNLERWRVADRLHVVRADAFRALLSPSWLSRPIGVYFYDGAHDRFAQYLGLGLVQPLLADEALVLVDDTSRPNVGAAIDAFARSHREFELLLDLRAERESDPRWWNGIRAYAYRRAAEPEGGGRQGLDLAWRRTFYLDAYQPAFEFAARTGRRLMDASPRLRAAAQRAAAPFVPKVKGRP